MSPSLLTKKYAATLVLALNLPTTIAFVSFVPHNMRHQTSLNLEDKIANMIDREVHRLDHLSEHHAEEVKKNTVILTEHLPDEFELAQFGALDDTGNLIEQRKDRRLADRNPERYCADRCIATGNCEVFEDFFELSPLQVIQFCEECVLSEDEVPCDVPLAAMDKYIDGTTLRP